MSKPGKVSNLMKMFELNNCFTEEKVEAPAVPRHRRVLNSTVSKISVLVAENYEVVDQSSDQSSDQTQRPESFNRYRYTAWESIDQLKEGVNERPQSVQNLTTEQIDYSKEAKLLPMAPKPKIEPKPKFLMNELSDGKTRKVLAELNLWKFNQKHCSGEILEPVNFCQDEQEEPEENIPLPIRAASRPRRNVSFESQDEQEEQEKPEEPEEDVPLPIKTASRPHRSFSFKAKSVPPAPEPHQTDHSIGQLPQEQNLNWIELNPSNQINDDIAEHDNEINAFANDLQKQVEKSWTVNELAKRVEELTEKLRAKIFLLSVSPKKKFEANNAVIAIIDNLLISYKGVNRRDLYLLKVVQNTKN